MLHLPQGFRAAGVHCGVKKDSQKDDLALIVSDGPAVAAGVYTQNLVFAAPVAVDRSRTPGDRIRAVVINSGNANACTGERGLADATEMARLAAAACGAATEQGLVMSTGVIGFFLPLEKIAAGIAAAKDKLAPDAASFIAAARAIMTTDTVPKLASRTLSVGGTTVNLLGLCKGAAMIGPNMATMLGLVLTDAPLAPADAQRLLGAAVADSFNCISVEGHTSTNDTVLLLANGAATPGRAPFTGDDLARFAAELNAVCTELAIAIVDDGEGTTHRVTLDVLGCRSRADAELIAKAIANSPLVKSAIHGADPNWGRIVSAAGYAGVPFDPTRAELEVNGHLLFRAGAPVAFDAKTVSQSIREHRETKVVLRVHAGAANLRFWTTDITAEYVRLNADYTT